MTVSQDRAGYYYASDARWPTPEERDLHQLVIDAHRPFCASLCTGNPDDVHRGSWMTDEQWATFVAGWWQGRS